LALSTQGYNKHLHVKKVTSLSASYYILNICVLLVLRLHDEIVFL